MNQRLAHYPQLLHIVLDGFDIRSLAEFYRRLLGLHYRCGDEPPPEGENDDPDRLVLLDDDGRRCLDFARREDIPGIPREMGGAGRIPLDFAVDGVVALREMHRRALDLGAVSVLDRSDDPRGPLAIYSDPAGRPFCIKAPGATQAGEGVPERRVWGAPVLAV